MNTNINQRDSIKEFYCTECGEKINSKFNFCTNCGTRTIRKEVNSQPTIENVTLNNQSYETDDTSTSFNRDTFSQNIFRAIGRLIVRSSLTIIYSLFALTRGGILVIAIPFFIIWVLVGLIPRRRGICPYCGQENMNELIVNDRDAIECKNCDQKSIYDANTQRLYQSQGYRGKSSIF